MVRITAGDQEFTYERRARSRSTNVYELALVVESTTGEVSIRGTEVAASSRDDLSTDAIGEAIADWKAAHPHLTVKHFVVRETNRCGFGASVGAVEDEATVPDLDAGDSAGETGEVLYRGGSTARQAVGFDQVDVEAGEDVEFHVAGPSTSVYGTETGTVTDVKSGTDDHFLIVVDTGSGTKRIREDWLVNADDGNDGSDEADADDTS